MEPATNCIPEFIKMIEGLLEKGYAYQAGGNVYFDTSKLDNYYVFSTQAELETLVGVRDDVDEDTNKKNKTDFVLWFTKSKFEDQALNGIAHGASVIRDGILSAPASVSNILASTWISIAAVWIIFPTSHQ